MLLHTERTHQIINNNSLKGCMLLMFLLCQYDVKKISTNSFFIFSGTLCCL